MLGIQMLKKLFNKCIEINRIIKAIVLLVCACARPVRPQPRPRARSVRSRPRARSVRSNPLASAWLAPVALRTIGIDIITNCFNLFQPVSIRFNPGGILHHALPVLTPFKDYKYRSFRLCVSLTPTSQGDTTPKSPEAWLPLQK